jgi:hypothetical protein
MQSDASPVACSVEEPSKPQIGGVVTLSFRILVLERRRGVGCVPSLQMYSAWYGTVVSFVGVFRLNGTYVAVRQFLFHVLIVNAV